MAIFPSYDLLTPVTYELVGENLTTILGDFRFDESANISSVRDAIALMTLSPTVISSEDQLTNLLTSVLLSTGVSNDTAAIEILLSEYSCVVYQYARDTNTTAYLTLQSIVENALFNRTVSPELNITVEQCNCIQLTLQVFSNGVRCLATQSFLYGNESFNDGGVARETLALFALAFSTLILAFFQTFFIRVSTDHWVHRVRLVYYRAVLRQNIGWFDLNPSNALACRLEE